MKVFFTGSPRALRIPTYKFDLIHIFNAIEKHGTNVSRLVIDANPDEFYSLSYAGVVKHYQTTINHLKEADVIVAEVSMQSMAMGFLVNKALELSKPMLCLHARDKEPFFLSGIINSNLVISEYETKTISQVVDEAFEYFASNKDKRFNLMLSPQIANFLNDRAEKLNITKAEIIREAVLKLMEQNTQ